MTIPLATFVSKRLHRRDEWALHPTHLEHRVVVLGKVRSTKVIPLAALKPWNRSFAQLHWLTWSGLGVGFLGVLFWVGAVLVAGQSRAAWIPVRGVRLMCVGAAMTLLALCLRERHFGIGGEPPVYIQHTRWEREDAGRFVEHTVEQVRAVGDERPEGRLGSGPEQGNH